MRNTASDKAWAFAPTGTSVTDADTGDAEMQHSPRPQAQRRHGRRYATRMDLPMSAGASCRGFAVRRGRSDGRRDGKTFMGERCGQRLGSIKGQIIATANERSLKACVARSWSAAPPASRDMSRRTLGFLPGRRSGPLLRQLHSTSKAPIHSVRAPRLEGGPGRPLFFGRPTSPQAHRACRAWAAPYSASGIALKAANAHANERGCTFNT